MSSFFPYIGGKRLLVKRILGLIPEHSTYVEVFLGSGTVALSKEPSHYEVLNDVNKELVTLWRVIRDHLSEFARLYMGVCNSRAEFDRLKATPPETMTDIQRAIRFYYLLRAGYAGKPEGHFALICQEPHVKKVTLEQIYGSIKDVQKRLKRPGLTLECRDWRWILERCDGDDTFFYLDPPYFGFEDYYGKEVFSRADFAELASRLTTVRGKWLLSLNDVPEVRELFGAFRLDEAVVTYSAGAMHGAGKKVGELLISNYEPPVPPSSKEALGEHCLTEEVGAS